MSFTTDCNKTHTNTSFDGSDDANTGNDSIEIDEDDPKIKTKPINTTLLITL